MMLRDRITLLVAELSIFGLTVLGWVLSYSALTRLAEEHGYSGWEARLWPLTVDLLALASAMIAMALARRGHGPTGEAWAMAVVAALATLVGNVLSAGGDAIAMALHAWPAACMVGAWHLFFRSMESGSEDAERSRAVALSPAGAPAAEALPPARERSRALLAAASASRSRERSRAGRGRRSQRRSAADVLALVGDAREHLLAELGREPSDEEVAALTSRRGHRLSASRTRAYLAELRTPERSEAGSGNGRLGRSMPLPPPGGVRLIEVGERSGAGDEAPGAGKEVPA